MQDSIKELLPILAKEPFNPFFNMMIGIEYEKIGQTASAVSYYLRCAEYGAESQPYLTYSALIRISLCLSGQGGRPNTVTSTLLQAIAFMPERPEAYLFLSIFYEQTGNMQESYTYASIAHRLAENSSTTLDYLPEYSGFYATKAQKASSGWMIGRSIESATSLVELAENPEVPQHWRMFGSARLTHLGLSLQQIAIILPVRDAGTGRNFRLDRCLPSWLQMTEGLSTVHLIVDDDDVHNYERFKTFHNRVKVHVVPAGITLMEKINLVAPHLAQIYGYMSFIGDDIIFRTKWESKFINYLSSVPVGLAFGDTMDDKGGLATHPCITTNMIRAVGFYGCPAVHHNYFDNYWTDVANELGYIKYFPDIKMEHMSLKLPQDEIFLKIVNLQREDKPRYEKYIQDNFESDIEKIKRYAAL